ncbi:MAG: peptidase S41, partial [Flavobacteriaceae bacterium]
MNALRLISWRFVLMLSLSTLVMTSCFEDLDDVDRPASTLQINDFIWRGLNYFYLYKEQVPMLSDAAIDNEGDKNTYLASFESPEDCFDALTYSDDAFSLLVEDYLVLENALAGIALSNGMEYGLVYYPNDNTRIFGYVRYVLPGSDAESQSIERGMVFNRVDGIQLNTSNYSDLLEPDTYTLGWAEFDGTQIVELNQTSTLTKTQLTENPVHKTAVFQHSGHTVGYLMYNGFTNEFDNDLNAAFGQFMT